ncbi:MAG: HAMP domain-containing histidine kinase [Pseudomonadales bacterium]|nr:HAMP domain-containing histidine kinase [Pseudomonadales bacterium]
MNDSTIINETNANHRREFLGQAFLNRESLKYLASYIAFQTAIVATSLVAFQWLWGFALPERLAFVCLPGHCILTLFCVRLAMTRKQISTWQYLALLLCSVVLLAWFLHDSGGHTNPLISLFLVPLAMSAAMLGWLPSLTVALTIIAFYGGLMNYFEPLAVADMNVVADRGVGAGKDVVAGKDAGAVAQVQHMAHHHHGGDGQLTQLHLFGMWITFCLSAILILVLVIPLAASIRRQRETIAQQREQTLRDERIVAMATFAASAAHQLGTPLSTLSVIAEDLGEEFSTNKMVQDDIRVMQEQIAHCKTTLHSMMRKADAIRNDRQSQLLVTEFLENIRNQFNLLNPSYCVELPRQVSETLRINSDETLDQAFLNLLDNAARESRANPSVEVENTIDEVCLKIIDSGPGVADKVQQQLGQPFISSRSKSEGLGLGLFLSNATINRLGGRLALFSSKEGTVTEVWLPLVKASTSTLQAVE